MSRGERKAGTDESAEGSRDRVPGEPDDAPEPGDSWKSADASAYWRRRFFILCGGVAALGLCAWLFPGAHQAGQPSAAARASMAALATRQALPAAATGKAWAPSPSPSSSPTPAARQTRQKISLAYRPRAAAAKPAAAGGQSCARIVLSLFTSQSSYSAGGRPEFRVYAVSTAKSSCTLRYGAGSVQVVVTRQGQVVWNSAACKPSAAKPVTFTPGVPRVLTLTWNRGAAGTVPAGCAGSLPAGTAATLSAVALTGGKSSPVSTFKLRPGQAAKGSAQSESGKAQPGPSQSGPSKQYKPR